MGIQKSTQIAIFASGAGSNAKQIIAYFANDDTVNIAVVVCNKPEAGVLSIAAENGIKTILIKRTRFFHGDAYLPELQSLSVDYIILAGFLWKVPPVLIAAFPKKIINIHPALLPHYGGKGMYGAHVHEAVIAHGEKESGITIHLVDELYDNGRHLLQARCTVTAEDTPDTLAQKIHQLEHAHFAPTIDRYIHEQRK